MMKKKSILAIGLTAALLFGLTGEVEAFGWGDIAGKAADKAIGSVLGSSAQKKPVKQSPPKSEKQKKSEREAEKYGVKRIESPDARIPLLLQVRSIHGRRMNSPHAQTGSTTARSLG